ncbi:glycoside hydrolase family 30 protein [Aestuariicella hydrocarbonica]|uniref:Glycoside hydrolase family 30 protein n=2 Tax=Pseudomaricurvus hydrocarbonicus TaxID=1470433 RepID=A0A9E5MN78_9GAMM|nr:glycoside hydrolase family 30 protein [Aestuariicella hydrocarbonica]
MDRRRFLTTVGAIASATASSHLLADKVPSASVPVWSGTKKSSGQTSAIRWLSTSRTRPWTALHHAELGPNDSSDLFSYDLQIQLNDPKQTMVGFGGAFSEKGWQGISSLPHDMQQEILRAIFSPDTGANFNIARTPMGASDFALGWYSYDETPGDFLLENFSIENDRTSLIPYIRSAMQYQPDLKIWASPWSPPTWMKTNRHYAMAPAWPGQPSNGIQPDQLGSEGNDYFIQEKTYFEAYARYFRRYVEEYQKAGIPLCAVMPQNEFNSAQPFPSCCWTPEGLARFIPYLGAEMDKVNVDVLLGTLERDNPYLVDQILAVPQAERVIKGVGVQWAGRGALPFIAKRHPKLAIWGTEHECGTGANDWHYTHYAWDMIKTYLQHGASAYHYWNIALTTDPFSTWGWPQNSLVTIDPEARSYQFNHEYYLMKHFSQFISRGARFLPATSFLGFENQLAFQNPDKSIVLVIQNEMAEVLPVRVKIGDKILRADLPADTFNTLHVPARLMPSALT